MPILRPMILPTSGIPAPVIASRRPRNMTQRDFYQFPQSNPQLQQQQGQDSFQTPQQTNINRTASEFEPTSITGDYLQEQLDRFSQRTAPPQLEPGARVKSANAELVQPSNFQIYYEQMQSIDQQSQEMLGAETARSAFRRMQEMQSMQGAPSFGGLPVGYKRGSGKSISKGGGGSTPLFGNRAQAESIMRNMAGQWGWSGVEWDALRRLMMKESGFNPNAANPTSSARGLFQKMTSIHGPLEPTIEGQILWGFNYIKRRYGSPSRALQFHLGHNWY